MLVVKVEVWPGGEGDRAVEISRLGIANVTGLQRISNYEVTALTERDGIEFVRRTTVALHDRHSGWIPLVQRTLKHLDEDLAVLAPYDDPTAEMLRRDGHV